MVLVDTSIWIRFLMNREPWASELEKLLTERQVAGHDLVFGELLIGNSGGRLKVLDAYRFMPWAQTVPHAKVVDFVQSRGLAGRGAGWIDIHLIASALVDKLQLWTTDQSVADIARDLKIAYRLSSVQ